MSVSPCFLGWDKRSPLLEAVECWLCPECEVSLPLALWDRVGAAPRGPWGLPRVGIGQTPLPPQSAPLCGAVLPALCVCAAQGRFPVGRGS